MEAVKLQAHKRSELGTGAARALRKKGLVPAIIYGANKKPVSIALEEKEITKYYRKPQYISQLFEFELDGKKIKVLPKDVELHPITEMVRHADFVFLESKIQKMEVPVIYANRENCVGIKRGGYFNIVKRRLKLLCPVDNLPRAIEIDTTNMSIGISLKAGEVTLPENCQLVGKTDFVIASIIGKRGKATEEESSAEGEQKA